MMNNFPEQVGSDQHDLDDELTRLEWQASQRSLTQQETERLNTLRQQKTELRKDIKTRVEPPHPGNPVISGDDSP